MSSPCLSGAGRTYALDLEMIKSPSTSTRTSHSSSPSSTLSESSNSPVAISTRKPRTARKRPKQTYNEAAALLSTAYPKIFSANHLTNPSKFTKPHQQPFSDESSELLLPFRVFDNSGFLLDKPIQDKPRFPFERKVASNNGSGEVVDSFQGNHSLVVSGNCDYHEDFDAESILDEEIEEGIDSIMGNLSMDNDLFVDESSGHNNSWYVNPMGIGFGGKLPDFRFGMRSGVSAWRHVDEGSWWSFPTVNLLQISPKPFSRKKSVPSEKKKKKKVDQKEQKQPRVVQSKMVSELNSNESSSPVPKQANSAELLLKLKYDDVLTAWSDRGSPFLDESLSSDVQGNDLSARLAQIDLFSESGVREASVLRYKEKRRTRLFSTKIRYQVRKVNADRRPRMKGRFVRRPNSSTSSQGGKGKKKVLLSDL